MPYNAMQYNTIQLQYHKSNTYTTHIPYNTKYNTKQYNTIQYI